MNRLSKVLAVAALGLLTVGCVEEEKPQCQDCFLVVGYTYGIFLPTLSGVSEGDLTIITQNQCSGLMEMHTRKIRGVSNDQVEKSYPKLTCWTGWK